MSLLAGIVGSGYLPYKLNPNLASPEIDFNASSSSLTMVGGSVGDLYILVHSAYNLSGISTAPSTPSGFTSLSSQATSGNIFSVRVSYKILTDTNSITLPSVSGASGQVAQAIKVQALRGAFSSASLQDSTGYTYNTNVVSTSNTLSSYLTDDIGISLNVQYPNTLQITSDFATPRTRTQVPGGPIGDEFVLSVSGKAFTESGSATVSFDYFNNPTTTLSNVLNIRPTFV